MAAPNSAVYPSRLGCSSSGSRTAASFATTYESLPDGEEGTFRSLDAMAEAVRGEVPPDFSGYTDPAVIRFADQLVGNASGDERAEMAALYDYVAHRLAYIEHPPEQQTIQDALRTIQIGSGDCVSKSVLLATLLLARDIPARFVGQYTSDSSGYSHVYVEAQLPDGNWYPLDPVASDKPMGWTQPLCDDCFETTWDLFK
jgi:transglutaminase-like putative cysteine protease